MRAADLLPKKRWKARRRTRAMTRRRTRRRTKQRHRRTPLSLNHCPREALRI
jgi:hypothetical protein